MLKKLSLSHREKELVPTQHFFIHLRVDNEELSFGRYGLSRTRFGPIEKYNGLKEFITHIEPFFKENGEILVYIHGFMAHVGIFERKVGFILQNQLFNPLKDKFPIVISLKWESERDYKESIKSAPLKASLLLNAIMEIDQAYRNKSTFPSWSWLCHSMGNRIFAHLFAAWYKVHPGFSFGEVVLMAADVPGDVFDKELENLPSCAHKILIFKSISDKTLEIANWIVPYPRLGSVGITSINQHKNIQEVDVSGINDHEGLAPRLLKHRYYYASATIRAYLLVILQGEDKD